MTKLTVTVYSEKQIKDMITLGVDIIRLADERYSYTGKGVYSLEDIDNLLELLRDKNIELQFKMERLIHQSNLDLFLNLAKNLFKRNIKIIFSDFAVYQIAVECNYTHLLIYEPYTLNTNDKTLNLFFEKGIGSIGLSRQLRFPKMLEILENVNSNIEIQVQGKVPIFFSNRLLVSNYMEYTNMSLSNLNEVYYLEEELRETEKYPIKEYEFGTTVFCSHEINLLDKLLILRNENVYSFLIENITYTDDELYKIVSIYKEALNSNVADLEMNIKKLNDILKDNFLSLVDKAEVII